MYMDALESEVESLSSEVTRLRLMLHRVTQIMEVPPMAEPAYGTAAAASAGHATAFTRPTPSLFQPPAQSAPQHADPMNQLQQLSELLKHAGSLDLIRQMLSAEKEMGESTDSHTTKLSGSYKKARRGTKAPPLNDTGLAADSAEEPKGRTSLSSEDLHFSSRLPSGGKSQAAPVNEQSFVKHTQEEAKVADHASHDANTKRSSDTMYMSKTPGMWSFPTPTMADRGEESTPLSVHQETRKPQKEVPKSRGTVKQLSVVERLQQLKEEPSSSLQMDDSDLPPAAGARRGGDAARAQNIEASQQSTESMVMPSMHTAESVTGKKPNAVSPTPATTGEGHAVHFKGNDVSNESYSCFHSAGPEDDGMPQALTLAEPPTNIPSPSTPQGSSTATKYVPAQTSVLSHNSSEEEDVNVPIMGQGQEAVILGARRSIGRGGGGSPPLAPAAARTGSAAVDVSPNLTPSKGVRTQTQTRESILDRLRRHTGGYDSSEEEEEEEEGEEEEEDKEEEITQAHRRAEEGAEQDGDVLESQRPESTSQRGLDGSSPERMHYTPVNASRNEIGYSYGTLDAYSLGWRSPSQGASPQQPAIESNQNNNAHAPPSAGKSASARSVVDYDWGIGSSPAAAQSVQSSHSELPSTGYYDF